MIQGRVVGLQAEVEVRFRLPDGAEVGVQFVVDTGFAGALTLPPAAVSAMGLPFLERITASLASGDPVRVGVHFATILWDGRETDVAVLAMGRRPLLGTALLDGFNLNADFTDNGPVSLQRL